MSNRVFFRVAVSASLVSMLMLAACGGDDEAASDGEPGGSGGAAGTAGVGGGGSGGGTGGVGETYAGPSGRAVGSYEGTGPYGESVQDQLGVEISPDGTVQVYVDGEATPVPMQWTKAGNGWALSFSGSVPGSSVVTEVKGTVEVDGGTARFSGSGTWEGDDGSTGTWTLDLIDWNPVETGVDGSFTRITFFDENAGWAYGFSADQETEEQGILIRTTDGGDTWSEAALLPLVPSQLAPLDAQTLFAATDGGLRSSTDGGTTWSSAVGTLDGCSRLEDLHFVNEHTGWLIEGDQSKVFRTDDGGHTWVEQYQYPDPDNSLFFDVFFADDTHGWIAAHSGRVMRTTDGGQTWEVSTPGEGQNLHSVFFHDAERGWVVGDNGTVLRTADGGASWTSLSLGHGDYSRVVFSDVAHGFLLASGGAYRFTQDGGANWDTEPSGIPTSVMDVVFVDAEVGFLVDHAGSVYATADAGLSWSFVGAAAESDPRVLHFSSASTGWMSGADGTWVTHNGGMDWDDSGLGGGMSSIHSASENGVWVSNGGGQAFATKDAGETWEVLSFGSVGGVQVQGDDVWATGNGWLRGLIHSSDAGQTWQLMPSQVESVHFVTEQVAYGLDIDYPAQELRLVRTEDGGATFSDLYTVTNWSEGLPSYWFADEQVGMVAIGSYGSDSMLLRISQGLVEDLTPSLSALDASKVLGIGGVDARVCMAVESYGWAMGWGVYCSTDLGESWEAESLDAPGFFGGAVDPSTTSSAWLTFSDSNTAWVARGDLFRTGF